MAVQLPPRPPQWSSWNEFADWFWDKRYDHGQNLITDLNTRSLEIHKRNGYFIRQEYDSPSIYCIVINNDMGVGEWKYCKVGFTHRNTTPGSVNRMEKVMAELKKQPRFSRLSVIFCLPIDFVDIRTFTDVEKWVKEGVTLRVQKEVAKNLHLPYATEWVLTPQQHIDEIKKEINWEGKSQVATTKVFKRVRFDKEILHQVPLPSHLDFRESVVLPRQRADYRKADQIGQSRLRKPTDLRSILQAKARARSRLKPY